MTGSQVSCLVTKPIERTPTQEVGNNNGESRAVAQSVPLGVQSLCCHPVCRELRSRTCIVGDKVILNPVFTIIVVALGGAVWGVIGMLVPNPVLGIAKVVFDNIPALNTLGYFFSEEDIGQD